MSCLVPGRARAKFNLSRSRSGRSRSIGERLFLVLVVPRSRSFLKFKTVVPCSRSFLSSKLSFLVPGRSGSNLSGRSGSFRVVLVRTNRFWNKFVRWTELWSVKNFKNGTAHLIRRANRTMFVLSEHLLCEHFEDRTFEIKRKLIIRIWARN